MYRFLKSQGVSVQYVYFASRQAIGHHSVQFCSFCNFYHRRMPRPLNYFQIRRHTTTINTAELEAKIKKRIKSRSKKYAELLEVTKNTTSNKKAAVMKLNAAHLSAFIKEPDITLDKLHVVSNSHLDKNIGATTGNGVNTNKNIENYGDIDILSEPLLLKNIDDHSDNKRVIYEDLQEDEIPNHVELLKHHPMLHGTLEDIRHSEESVQPKEPDLEEQENKSFKQKMRKKNLMLIEKERLKEEFQAERRRVADEQFVHTLLAHLEVYINCGMLNRASKTLMLYSKTKNRLQLHSNFVKLYNVLLEAYASRGSFDKVMELYTHMKENSLVPSPQTYACIFQSIGRLSGCALHKELLKTLRTEMKKNDISLNDVFTKSAFQNNHQQYVLKAVRILEPKFRPSYALPDTDYKCMLLNKINSTSNRKSPAEGVVSFGELQNASDLQIQIESVGEVEVNSIEKYDVDMNQINKSRQKLTEIQNNWRTVISQSFDKNLSYLKQKESAGFRSSLILYPFLEVLDKEFYVNAIMREIKYLCEGSESFSICKTILYANLGRYIYKKYEIKTKMENGVLDKTREVYRKYIDWYLHNGTLIDGCNVNGRIAWKIFEQEARKQGTSLNITCTKWPHYVFTNIGKFLYNIILNDVKLNIDTKAGTPDKFIPGFYSLFRYRGKFVVEEVKPHPILAKLYKEAKFNTLTFETIYLPSLSPPRPWTSLRTGGYLISNANFIRAVHFAEQVWRRFETTKQDNFCPMFDSLNQLGSIPWSVNGPVLDVIIEVFRNGGSEKLEVPQPPSILPSVPALDKNASKQDKFKIARMRAQLKRKASEMYSLWCDALYKLSLANHYRDKVFWLPHNLDFRGRVYPIPPHLSHLGSDLARSILVFAQKKPLGPNGLDWLKIHAINLTGFQKRNSVSDRLKFANENIDKIVDSAENPLTGEQWWMEADEPWQTLAACKEIAAALKSPNVEKYLSSFPIHQDGSCNGLQHYAALGRDEIGAKCVNLAPCDTPQDVYSDVAGMVEEIRKRDAAEGNTVAQALEGFVQRKVIKQTVMTTVYGVTKYGAKYQILKQLKDLDDFPQEYMWQASLYLVDKTFQSLRTMFTSAREIQDWFTTCARIITSGEGQSVEWVTPLGLPVLQPYFKRQKTTVGKNEIDILVKPDTIKQKNAFPPNFIHSLDSSHMSLTGLHCEHAGITFMSVHDCYWTHPCTVEIMNKICREQFVALHSEPILQNLSDFFVQRYSGANRKSMSWKLNTTDLDYFTQVPSTGNFDLKKVLSSVYFFS